MDSSKTYRVGWLKVVLLLSSVATFVLLLIAAYEENFTAQWRSYQQDYARLQTKSLSQNPSGSTQRPGKSAPSNGLGTGSKQGKSKVEYPIEIRQVFLQEWNRIDRCVTCHTGIDNPAMKDAEQPLATHPGDILQHHPADKFGCTVCHQGQGRATDEDAAHGHVPYWDEPLLAGDFVQATCTQCHHGDEVPQAPVLNRGRQLLTELGCVGCHKTGMLATKEKVGPQLDSIGSKVSPKWLEKWLTNPKDYLPKGRMPHFRLNPGAVQALSAYLLTQRNEAIDKRPDVEGDYEAGGTVYREAQCIVCHVTKLDYAENPVGGDIGPSLLKIGNKVNQRWLATFFQSPHSFLPHTKMPGYHFSEKEAIDLSQFAIEEWTDYDLSDAEEKEPAPPKGTPEQIRQGKQLYVGLGCAGCHELKGMGEKPSAPELTFIGSTPVHQLNFGDAKIRRTVPDFLYTKLKSPQSLHHRFVLPPEENAASTIWEHLQPVALFSKANGLPDGSDSENLAWILKQAKQAGVLEEKLMLPGGSPPEQAKWLVWALQEAGALNPLKMPNFHLSDADAEALTIALMSLSEVGAPSKRFEAPTKPKVVFNPQDEFGKLERHYRCLSCHSIRESGELLASDLTYEGNRANRQWLYHYLNQPYSMRRTITIAMPIFHFPHEESRLLADYISQVFVDSQLGADWKLHRQQADSKRGQALFDAKGCIACHQLHGTGGDVGPSLTIQVPEFPQGTWVGDKLKGEWIYAWLKDPQALLPETIEPNMGLTDQETLDLTAFLLSLKNPEYQESKHQESDEAKDGENP